MMNFSNQILLAPKSPLKDGGGRLSNQTMPAAKEERFSVTVTHAGSSSDIQYSIVNLRGNGIEISTENPVLPWSKVGITLRSGMDSIQSEGIVLTSARVGEQGYLVAIMFLNLTADFRALVGKIREHQAS